MNKITGIATIIITIAIFSTFSYGQLADAPWPMFRNNLLHSGQSEFNGPWAFELAWKFPTKDVITSSPSIDVDGTIYIGSDNGNMYAINPSGTMKWRYETNGPIKSSVAINQDGTIYFGSGDKKLYAINSDGTLKWTYETDGYIFSSPAIGNDGTIYFIASSYLFAIISDGSLRWKRELEFTEDPILATSPAIGSDGNIFISRNCFPPMNGFIYSIGSDSIIKWKYQSNDHFFSSPAIDENGTIYSGTYEGNYMYAIKKDGTMKWKFATGSRIWSSPAIGNDGNIYFGTYGGVLHAVNRETGIQSWNFQANGPIDTSPAIGADNVIYFGSGTGHFYAVDNDGLQVWNYQTGSAINSSPAIAEDGSIYFGCDDGYLYAISGAFQIDIGLQLIPEKEYYNDGDSIQLFMDFKKSAAALNVDLLFALYDSALNRLFFAPNWTDSPYAIIQNIPLPANMPPFEGAFIYEVSLPSFKPPIKNAGDYSFAIVATIPGTYDFVSNIAFTSFTVK